MHRTLPLRINGRASQLASLPPRSLRTSNAGGGLQPVPAERQADSQRGSRIEALLPHALAAGEFALAYQPIMDSVTRETVGAEALLRWTNSELGDVAPAEFIPIAEKTSLLKNIGDWALRRACAQAACWRRTVAPRLVVSVNVSAVQFDESLVRHIMTCLERTGLEASALQLEITESVSMPDTAAIAATARALRDLGVARRRRLRDRLCVVVVLEAIPSAQPEDRPAVRCGSAGQSRLDRDHTRDHRHGACPSHDRDRRRRRDDRSGHGLMGARLRLAAGLSVRPRDKPGEIRSCIEPIDRKSRHSRRPEPGERFVRTLTGPPPAYACQ